uniref:Uncharacterized protein n=1 Tax=Triticum urartu TaxID=4572 RepID=A0A8R7VDP1_TRIUA
MAAAPHVVILTSSGLGHVPSVRAGEAPRRAPRLHRHHRHLRQPVLVRPLLAAGLAPAGRLRRRAAGGVPRRPPRRRALGDSHPHRHQTLPATATRPTTLPPRPPGGDHRLRDRHALPR